MTRARRLSPAMLEALAWAATHKGQVSHGPGRSFGGARPTLKALAELGLLEFVTASAWKHGVGNVVVYRLAPKGRELARIGRMFAGLARP